MTLRAVAPVSISGTALVGGTPNGVLYLDNSGFLSSGSALTFDGAKVFEGTYPLVSQADIGTAPNEVPLNQYLGNLAFMGSDQLVINPVASATPVGIGDMVFQLTNNTTLVVKVKGSDGTVRSATLTLA